VKQPGVASEASRASPVKRGKRQEYIGVLFLIDSPYRISSASTTYMHTCLLRATCSISSSSLAHYSNESLLRKPTYSQGPLKSLNPATTEDHSPNSSSLTAYRCTKCHKQYKHRRSQRRHFQVYHTKESQQTCPYCKGCFSRKDVLDVHLGPDYGGMEAISTTRIQSRST
jgi:hypothetical protein